MMQKYLDKQTQGIMNNNLANKGWHVNRNSPQKNVFCQNPPDPEHQEKLKGRKPDYILYQTGTQKPIALIEVKKGGANLQETLAQGMHYAKALDIPLVFAMNGTYGETRFVPNGKSLLLNGNEVRGLIREAEVLKFIEANSNEVYTLPPSVVVSRQSLIKIFKNLNDILKSEGLRAGIERFSEFANILFLKLLSENNERSWWSSIKTQSNADIIGYINGHVMQEIHHQYGNGVFTPLLIKNPQTLRYIIDSLDPLIFSTIDTDIKGDAFEYFLANTTSTKNDLGEYFTPRNVVKAVVNLVDPKFKETIYDPFCGTGGFLTGVLHYIKENSPATEGKPGRLRHSHPILFGREITVTARIAKMNMILQGHDPNGIQQMDSLANPDYRGKDNKPVKFDVIVTNMPFSQNLTRKVATENGKTRTENPISPLYYNGIAKHSGDAACVLHCLRNLKEGGRMGLVVPEGFLFRKDIANVREFLLSKAKLQAVISLPQGTFLPYTGVKTDILYFTNAHKPNTQKEYWFFDVKNIGVTLDNHKRKIEGMNDLNKIELSNIKRIDKNPSSKASMLEAGFEMIDLNKVKAHQYNLAGNFYREFKKDGRYQHVQLGNKEYFDIVCGGTPKTNHAEYWENGHINWATLVDLPSSQAINKVLNTNRKITEKGLNHSNAKLLPVGSVIVSTKITIGKIGIVTEKELATSEGLIGIIIKSNKIIPQYLAYALKLQKEKLESIANGTIFPEISKANFETIEIPVPPLESQKKIIKELELKKKYRN